MATQPKPKSPNASSGKAAATTGAKRGRRRSGSKSEAIRAYLRTHRDVGPTAVCAALKKKGLVVTPAHVSNVKAAMAREAGAQSGTPLGAGPLGRRGRKSGAIDMVSMADLKEARRFAERVGGVERAASLLQSLAELQHQALPSGGARRGP